MPLLLLLRRLHKWVGLVLGLQLVLWAVSGTAMAVLDHHAVAGEHVVREPAPRTLSADPVPLAALAARLPGERILGFKLRPLLDGYVYEVRTAAGTRLIDSAGGQVVAVDADLARALAEAEYAGAGAVASVTRVTEPTLEARGRPGPLWRVAFDDEPHTTFYVSEATAQVVERRTDAWRLWDFFWMLHIMDYGQRESFNHPLIVTAATGAVWMALTGFMLLFVSFRGSDFGPLAGLGRRLRR